MMLSKRKDEETLCAAYNTDGALIYHFHQSDILPAKKEKHCTTNCFGYVVVRTRV